MELSRKVLGAPSPGRLLQGSFAGDAPEACPEPVEGTGAESVFKDFPGDLICRKEGEYEAKSLIHSLELADAGSHPLACW
jgi:hypothetical protein